MGRKADKSEKIWAEKRTGQHTGRPKNNVNRRCTLIIRAVHRNDHRHFYQNESLCRCTLIIWAALSTKKGVP